MNQRSGAVEASLPPSPGSTSTAWPSPRPEPPTADLRSPQTRRTRVPLELPEPPTSATRTTRHDSTLPSERARQHAPRAQPARQRNEPTKGRGAGRAIYPGYSEPSRTTSEPTCARRPALNGEWRRAFRDASLALTVCSIQLARPSKLDLLMRKPEIARLMTSCWISLVPSKIVWLKLSKFAASISCCSVPPSRPHSKGRVSLSGLNPTGSGVKLGVTSIFSAASVGVTSRASRSAAALGTTCSRRPRTPPTEIFR